MKKQLICTLLLCAMLVGAVSCGSAGAESKTADISAITGVTETTAGATETEAVDWTASGVAQTDYNGAAFTILSNDPQNDYAWYKLDSDTETGDVLNDAIYRRNKKIEDVFNIDINVVLTKSYQGDVQKTVNAGDSVYDISFGNLSVNFNLGVSGYLMDFNSLPHIDLEKQWWDASITKGLTYDGKLFTQSGAISPNVNVRTFALVFNKDLCTELGYQSPYDYVLGGTWTLDVFANYVKGVNSDLNGDGVMDYEDRWGFFSEDGNSFMTYFAAGGTVTERDGDTISVNFDSQRNIDILTKALEIITDPDVTLMANDYVTKNGGSWSVASAWYASGHALMRSSVFEPVPRDYRTMETDFGVLPYPKYSEDQDSYTGYTQSTSAFSIAVLKTTADADRTGAILEALAAQSVSTVENAFYDICLNGKYVRDEESKTTIDMIFDNKYFDIGNILDVGGFMSQVQGLEKKKSTDVTSMTAKIKDKAVTALDKYFETMADLG